MKLQRFIRIIIALAAAGTAGWFAGLLVESCANGITLSQL